MVTVMRRSPFHELDWMERGMRRMFDELGFAPSIVPAADVYETKNEFVVELDVPGFDEKELGIEVSDHMLVVTGERRDVEAEREKDFRLRERLEERFERRFHLPPEADTEHVKARFVKGVLEVHTPKLAATTPHKIEIEKA